MDDFNLLPSGYLSRWKVQWVPIIIVTTILLCAGSILLMEWNLSRINKDRTVIETSRRKRKDIADFNYLSMRAKMLSKEYESIENLITNHATWSNLLIELSESTPEGVLLDFISMNAEAEQGLWSIQGRAPSLQLVFTLEKSLKRMPYFETTAISTIAQNPHQENSGVVYEISCNFSKDVQ